MRKKKEKKKGFLGSLGTTLNKAARTISNETDKLILSGAKGLDKLSNEAVLKRFRSYFKQFNQSEQLWSEFYCYCIDSVQEFPVNLYISTNYLCFVYEKKDKQMLHVSIPLRSIQSIQLAVTVQRVNQLPLIQIVLDPNAKANALQIYTNNFKIHLFHRFFFFRFSKR